MAPDLQFLTDIIRKNLNKATLREVAFKKVEKESEIITDTDSSKNAFEDRTQRKRFLKKYL